MKRLRKYILGFLGLVLLVGGWWTYKLIWGKPLSFNHFVERILIERVLPDPELLSYLGMIENTVLDFHSDDLTNATQDFDDKKLELSRKNLKILRSYNREKLTQQERLTYDIVEWSLENHIRSATFLYHKENFFSGPYPVNQLEGVHIALPEFMTTIHRVTCRKGVENYISRLSQFGIKFDQVLEGLKLRENYGVIPPDFIIDKVLNQMRNFIDHHSEKNVLYTSFKANVEKIEDINEEQRAKYCQQVRSKIETTVYPAYEKLISYFESLKEKATADAGVWKLPDGDAYYAYILRSNTTTDYTPQQIYELGIQEVVRINGEMRTILDSLGHTGKTVAAHMQELANDPRFLYPDTEDGREQLLRDYKAIIDEIDQNISDAFSLRPQKGVEVRRVPEFKEKSAYAGSYDAPSLDDARPGIFWVNLRKLKNNTKFGMRTLAYHETIPGHHFQITIAQEVQGLPTFRKLIPFTAFAEGWALYAERLAWELGFHSDPYSNLGRLQAELMRAVRLVVDTGIHYKRWTREHAIEYMMNNTGLSEVEVTAEIERYVVRPGQATAYKIGMLKMLELRENAKQQLGARFDIREFHDVVLQNCAMPLGVLEKFVETYLKSKTSP